MQAQAQVSIVKRAAAEEQSLSEYVQRIGAHSERGWALHIHLSKLGPRSRNENLVFALDMFRALVSQFSGRVFMLRNSDVICVLKDSRIAEIKAALRRIQMLFHDDPLFHVEQDAESKFSTTYNLNDSLPQFQALVESLLAEPAAKPGAPAPSTPEQAPPVEAAPLDLARFAAIVNTVGTVDLARFVRHQPACLITEDRTIVPVFEEVYTSIPDLERALGPGTRLTADRWLFQHMTKALDRRTLQMLTAKNAPEAASDQDMAGLRARLLGSGNFSVNLNVGSVLSPEFQAFDASVSSMIRGTVVLEFHKIDVFADLGSFLYVRDFARKRGYRICLDGLSHLSLPFMDRGDLGVDLMKIYWTNDMPDDRMHIRKLVEHAGEHRVILCRCDTDQAIDYGRSIGITLFQGKRVDTMMGGQAKAPSFLWSFSAPVHANH
ncbi:MAG TPA: hypothetical protein VLV76_29155 [Candidatus Acidoferrum sp.]|nr:hypothetical protein [Candidatus Acidoferrum sp.]